MTTWLASDAETRFKELLAACLEQGPQVVIREGAETAVLVSFEEWRRLSGPSQVTLNSLSPSEASRAEGFALGRGRRRRYASEPSEDGTDP